jgi:transposase
LKEWNKEGVAIDAKGVYAGERPQAVLPRRWIVERTFAWLS